MEYARCRSASGRLRPIPLMVRFFILKQILDHAVELRTPNGPGGEIFGGLYQHSKRYQSSNASFKVSSEPLVMPRQKMASNWPVPTATRALHKALPQIHNFVCCLARLRRQVSGRLQPVAKTADWEAFAAAG